MKPVLFTIGKFAIHGYGFMIAIGVLAAYFVAEFRAKRLGLQPDKIFALTITCLLGGFLGAKILYYLVEIKNVIKDPSMLLDVGDGFVVYGGIITGILSGYIYCRVRKLNFLAYFDLVMPEIALAQAFGRLGCFMAGCCYGAETDAAWGLHFPANSVAPSGVGLVPIQLICAFLNFANFFALCYLAKKCKNKGQVASFYLLFYAVGRFVVEYWRADFERGSIGALSTSQFISIFIFIAGLLMMVYFTFKQKVDGYVANKWHKIFGKKTAYSNSGCDDCSYSNTPEEKQ